MYPSLKDGDLIIYKPYKPSKKKLIKGSIIILEHPLQKNNLIIKRILGIESEGIEIIGDNKYSSQDSRHFGLVNHNKVIGIAERRIRKIN